MRKKGAFWGCLLLLPISLFAQDLSKDYKVIFIHKKVGELAYDQPYRSPLENYVARMRLWIDGKYEPIYSEMIDAIVRSSEKKPYSPKAAENLLNSEVEQLVVYKDSVGLAFRKEKPDANFYVVGLSRLENGSWVGVGEDLCSAKNRNETKLYIESKAEKALQSLRQYGRQRIVSTDTLAFVSYLQQHGKNPKEYLLKKIAEHPLVIYGEIHRRKLSWDLLKNVVRAPQFTEVCSTVFMELPDYNLPVFDKFLNDSKLDTTLIFHILETEQQYGWQDKGEYEFIRELWQVNQKSKRKIRIIPVDFQANWKEIKTSADFRSYMDNGKDRDSTMAEIIYRNLNINDKRHSLFIVGMDHAKKSSSGRISAGTLLAEKLPENALFAVGSHALITDNVRWLGQVRYGLFDAVFEKSGNQPVAFDLKNSPFGQEPMDALHNRFSPDCRSYEAFYDGYIFLCAVKDEPAEYELPELYTDKFVEELKRRAALSNSKEGWYGIPAEELSKERIIEKIKTDKEKSGDKRYFKYFNTGDLKAGLSATSLRRLYFSAAKF
jgi:hypothetical protein